MLKHYLSTTVLLVMIFLAFGSTSSNTATKPESETTAKEPDGAGVLPKAVYAIPNLYDQMMYASFGKVVLLSATEANASSKRAHLEFNDRNAVEPISQLLLRIFGNSA